MRVVNMVSFFIILLVVFVLQQQPEEFAKPPDEANLMRIRIETTNPQELMAELGEKGFDILYGSKTDSTFEMIVTEKELMMIKLSGLKVIWKEYGRPLREIFKPADQHLGVSALPAGYHGYEGIIDQMKSIASAFPDIAQVVDITTDFNSPATFNGQHIYGMKISDNVDKGEDEQSVLIVATTHAREIGTLVLALYAMDQLTTNYGLDALTTTAVNNNEIWIIPVLNPDGYEHVYNVNNMWRKNRRVFLDGFGVDLNRNFPLGWDDPCSGSTYVMYGTYKGPEPLSEAESQNIVNFYETIHFAKYIDLHSYGREVIVSYSNCSTHPWHSWLKTEAEVFSASLGYYSIRRPSASGEIYHWLLSRGVYAFLVEVGTSFLPPYSSALDEASQLWPGLLALIERVTPLKGHITNVYTGAPIVNAAIEYPGIAFSNGEFFTSGQHGRFHSYLPGGNYALKITSDGFFSHEQTVSVAHGFSNTLDIKLYPTNLINSVSCYQTVNKSLFQIEYINVLNWEIYPLPQNKVVVGYNIYEIAGGNNLFIQQVRDSVSSYLHRNQNLREEKVYGITTLYDDGYESPPCIYHLKSTL